MERKERWQYYVSSYVRIEPTEGIPRARIAKTVLTRNLPTSNAATDNETDDGSRRLPAAYDENLTLRVCVNTCKLMYERMTSEYFIYGGNKIMGILDGESEIEQVEDKISRQKIVTEARTRRFKDRFVYNNKWMQGRTQIEVEETKLKFSTWLNGEELAPEDSASQVAEDAEPQSA